ncbi:RND efflux system, outer membrane lipoprotein CmeC [plant metagenome]|uniref:RND efflux system, outer membrane lipoprotein CmeC n=1 Tax=plant metagenome TaxID=1297885 RepID=A0A484PA50_9ZZZZ
MNPLSGNLRRQARPLALALLTVLLAGCTSLAPKYHQPDAPISAHWPTLPASAGGDGRAVDISWQQLIADPALREVMRLALENNRDLRIAVLNIEKSRAQYRIQRAELFPQAAVGAAASAQRTPASVSPSGVGGVSRSYSADVGISSYELDLFGRVRSLKAQALQSYLATEEAQRSVHISLMAEVATTYMTLVADLERSWLADETLRSRVEALALQWERHGVGSANDLELRQAEGEMEAARFDALALSSQVEQDFNALELLVGAPLPDSLQSQEPPRLGRTLGVEAIPAGLPSDLLQHRPDILAAEHRLIAANANIGTARAAFFPSIHLTGSAGRASDDLSELFDSGGRAWSFVPQISLPIFNGGRLRANLSISKADRDIAVAEYEKAIQTAFREVADALALRGVVDVQVEAQQKRVEAASAAYALVKLRYDNGVSGYLEVLDAQRTLNAAQQTLVQTELARQASLVALYKALGGGWTGSVETVASVGAPTRETE